MRSIVIPCLLVEWWRVDILKEARWSRRIAPTIPQLESGLCTLECDTGMMRVSIINERHSHECCTFCGRSLKMQKLLRNVCCYEFRSLALGIIYKQEQVHTLEQKQLPHIQQPTFHNLSTTHSLSIRNLIALPRGSPFSFLFSIVHAQN